MNAEILCIGTELLLGKVENSNVGFISRQLAELGINVYRHITVGDNLERIKKAVSQGLDCNDILIVTGGLGPTFDDITKKAVADYFGVPLILDEDSLSRIRDFFAKSGRLMTDNNVSQAMIPDGSIIVNNYYGTAPGIIYKKNNRCVIMLPGPPKEMQPMFIEEIRPFLLKECDKQVLVSDTVRTFGISESELEHRFDDYLHNLANPMIAPYASDGETYIRVTSRAQSEKEGMEKNAGVINHIKELFGEYIYGINVPDMQTAFFNLIKERNLSFSLAESCTGGLLSKKMTELPGVSEYYRGGVCTYSNESKIKLLGVNSKTLEDFGAVSSETAREMAVGAKKLFDSDFSVSITGIAGPTSDNTMKPVGLVYVGVAYKNEVCVKEYNLYRNLENPRTIIRELSSKEAMKLAMSFITKKQAAYCSP